MSILIYNDFGVSQECFKHTSLTLSHIFGATHTIQSVSSEELLNDALEAKTALLVFPGGADIPYMEKLKGKGNRKIRTYLEEGGAFLGLCAGAYYCAETVEFALKTPIEVHQSRELGFFPGVVRGPLLAPYDYDSNSGARVAKIHSKNENTLSVYYNGGGYFVGAHEKTNVSTLATYDTPEKHSAIIECYVGKGKALLSGVHIEFDPLHLDEKDPFLKPIILEMKKNDLQRSRFLAQLLKQFLFR